MPDLEKLKPHQYKPGESGNPSGRPPIVPEALNLRNFDKASFGRLVWKTWDSTITELKAIATNPESKGHEAWLASCCLKGIARGDIKALDWFCTRLGLPKLVEQLGIEVGLNESGRENIVRLIMNSNLMQDPEVRKQIVDVTPEPPKDKTS